MTHELNKTDLEITAIICDETNNTPEIIEQYKCVVRIKWIEKNHEKHKIDLEIKPLY